MSVLVKICGLTNVDDAFFALQSGADYLGFIMVPETPRYVSVAKVKKIVSRLPDTGKKVGVFLNHQPDDVIRILDDTGLDIAQLHGGEDEVFAAYVGTERVWKVLPVTTPAEVVIASGFNADKVLVDTFVKGVRGGTGVVGNWELARQVASERAMILAGGLNPENVAAAVRQVRPYAVDVSSGVEKTPGLKDRDAVVAFIRRAKTVMFDAGSGEAHDLE